MAEVRRGWGCTQKEKKNTRSATKAGLYQLQKQEKKGSVIADRDETKQHTFDYHSVTVEVKGGRRQQIQQKCVSGNSGHLAGEGWMAEGEKNSYGNGCEELKENKKPKVSYIGCVAGEVLSYRSWLTHNLYMIQL